MSATSAHTKPSRVLDGRYELNERVGSGGMASVFRGRDRRLGGREVAIKLLHPHLAERAESRRRFKNEADSAARLEHPNILKVYDASDVSNDESYIVMEFVHGQTLASLIEGRSLDVPELGVMIAHQVSLAVAHAHHSRILHRDIKPENIMVGADGVVKLMDFGIARALDDAKMTLTGAMIGSPAHMAPEQIEGKELDFRADVFSLGTVLYFLVTGVLPFTAASPHVVLRRILDGDYEPAQRVQPGVGRKLSRIIDRALAHDRDERYPDASALAAALTEYLEEFGLEDASREVAEWHRHPDVYEVALRKRVVEVLLRKAKRPHRHHRTEALDALNRVLCLDPDNVTAAELVRTMTHRGSVRKRLFWALAASSLAVVGFALWFWWPSSAGPDAGVVSGGTPVATQAGRVLPIAVGLTQPTLRAPRTEPDAWADNAPARRRLELAVPVERLPLQLEFDPLPVPPPVQTPSQTSVPPPVPPPKPPPTPALAEVTVYAHPKAVEVHIDGKLVPGVPHVTHLAPGTHTVVLDWPACKVCRTTTRSIEVGPGGKPQAFRFTIDYLPATLHVNSNVPGTIFIGSQRLGTTAEPLSVNIADPNGESRVVRVVAAGFSPIERKVKLVPGASATIDVQFAP